MDKFDPTVSLKKRNLTLVVFSFPHNYCKPPPPFKGILGELFFAKGFLLVS